MRRARLWWVVQSSAALFGVALAIGLAPVLDLRARPGALPGAMTAQGLDPAGPLLQFALLVVMTLLATFIGRRVAPLVLTKRWTAISYSVALASAPVTLMHFGTVRHVALHGLVAAAIVAARRLEPRFTRADVVLLPVVLSCAFAFYDIGFGRTPAATFLRAAIAIFALRVIVGVIARNDHPGRAFVAAPLALVAQMQWLEPRTSGVIALAILLLTPLALAAVRDSRQLGRFAAYVSYPLLIAAYPLTLIGIYSAPHVDFFEDAHNVLPAAEMARGERPYADVMPMHGLIADGVSDLLSMKLGATTLGPLLKTRRAESALNLAAIYFVALAATSSGDLALLASFLGIALFPSATVWLRTIAAFGALAAALAGTRQRARRWFIAAGVLTVVAFLFSVDFAIYSAVVVTIAAIRARSAKPFLIGIASATIPLLVIFAAGGFFADFFRVTFGETARSGSMYLIGPLDVPECLRSLTAILVNLDNPECFSLVVWVVALIGTAIAFASSPWRGRRIDALWLTALWIVIAAASYIERRHFYFTFLVGVFLVAALQALSRHHRMAAIALTVIVVFFARPFSHVFDVAWPLRRSHGFTAANLASAPKVPRAAGALFAPGAATGIETAQQFFNRALRPGETFYDFTNAGLLYYLLDRDCPVRYVEVPTYETESGQEEVIATLERNRRIRAALIAFPFTYASIDGIPNTDRAPLVARYLKTHFAPAFEQDGVVIWIRR